MKKFLVIVFSPPLKHLSLVKFSLETSTHTLVF